MNEEKWEGKKYLIIHPDEDGNVINFVDSDTLDEILNNEYMGEIKVLTKEDVERKGFNPQYWQDEDPKDILILPLQEPLKVHAVVKKWEVEKNV